MKKSFFFITGLAVLVFACSESTTQTDITPDPPHNPFDDIDYNSGVIPVAPVDSNTFLGLHTYILSKSCNQPACHDGTFEPDYRTVQSSYNTLVYHPITKNYDPAADGRNPLAYRVAPGDLDQSMIYHRLTMHNPPNFERMPSSGNPIPDKEIQLIADWIEAGAPDIYGNLPMPTSRQPLGFGMLAYLPDFFDLRIDTFRLDDNYLNPFIFPTGQDEMDIWFGFIDYDFEGTPSFGNTLSFNKIKFSTNPYDFSDAIEMDLEVVNDPQLIPSVFSQPNPDPLPYYQKITVNPASMGFSSEDIVYMRTYVKDDDHNEATESPADASQLIVKLHFSFYVQ